MTLRGLGEQQGRGLGDGGRSWGRRRAKWAVVASKLYRINIGESHARKMPGSHFERVSRELNASRHAFVTAHASHLVTFIQ